MVKHQLNFLKTITINCKDKFSAYLEVFGKFERLNKSQGSLLLLLHNFCSPSQTVKMVSPKFLFISFGNGKFFQNIILFGFMSPLTWELAMSRLSCFSGHFWHFSTVRDGSMTADPSWQVSCSHWHIG